MSTQTRFTRLVYYKRDFAEHLKQDVLSGLFREPRSIPPKYFYDKAGSELFDQICLTDEYYLTRTEFALFETYASAIVNQVQPAAIVELGSGTSHKTRILFRQLEVQNQAYYYFPMDCCEEVLTETGKNLIREFPLIHVCAIVDEHPRGLNHLPNDLGNTLYMFIGSSLGNFDEKESIELLKSVSGRMRENDYFLIGVDLVKDKNVLYAAYNDARGVTAAFNLNVLNVMNEWLEADFYLENFKHIAVYNEEEQQIEMYLESLKQQIVYFHELDRSLALAQGEKILTEISRKYTKSSIERLLFKSDLTVEAHFEPSNHYHALVLAKAKNH